MGWNHASVILASIVDDGLELYTDIERKKAKREDKPIKSRANNAIAYLATNWTYVYVPAQK